MFLCPGAPAAGVRIPVWHDDQQGTALVTLAALFNALKIVRKKINEVNVVMFGAGRPTSAPQAAHRRRG